MSEQVEVRECPCCGGDGLVLKSQYGNIGEHWVTCRQCRLKTGWYTTRDDAIAAWNQRAGEAELAALRALREGVDLEIMPVQAIAAILCSLHPDAAKLAGWIDRLQLALAACDEAMKGDSDV